MLNIKKIIDDSINQLRRIAPDTLYIGSLIKISRAVNPSNNTVSESTTQIPVEIISDVVSESEIDGINILATDSKFHIIADSGIDVDFYDEVRVERESVQKRLTIRKKTDIVIGTKNLMFTIIARG